MGTALRFLLIAIVVWYIIRYLVPALFGAPRKEDPPVKSKDEKQFRKSTRQGDVTITDFGKKSKNVRPDKEDYIDYEEVE